MLLLMRRIGESLRISDHLCITIKDIEAEVVTFAIETIDGSLIKEFCQSEVECV